MNRSSDDIKVLHVDDEPDFAEMAGDFLRRTEQRFSITTAPSAIEGRELISENGFDCVVSDYDMPGQNGIDFLKSVREDYPDLPFILYTGKGSEEVASEAISEGVTDYLQKGTGSSQYTLLSNRILNSVRQHRDRKAVKSTQENFRLLADQVDDILFMFTGDWGELLFINSAFEDIWGIPPERLESDPEAFLEYIHPEDRGDAQTSMERIAQGQPHEIEYRVIRPDGEQRWIRGNTRPIMDDRGNVIRIVGDVRDITDYKQTDG